MGDLHRKTPIAIQQKEELIALLKKLGSDSLIIVEDTSDGVFCAENEEYSLRAHLRPHKNAAEIIEGMKALPHTFTESFLALLTLRLTLENINTINVEFRLEKDSTTIEDLVQKYTLPILKEISRYTDGPLFSAYYHELLEGRRKGRIEDTIVDVHDVLPEVIYERRPEDRQKTIAELCNASVEATIAYWQKDDLLDARIVHTIYEHSGEKHIFVCVGAGHALKLSHALQRLDYQEIATTDSLKLSDSEIIENPIPVEIQHYFARILSSKRRCSIM